jgi:hypothetical protein
VSRLPGVTQRALSGVRRAQQLTASGPSSGDLGAASGRSSRLASGAHRRGGTLSLRSSGCGGYLFQGGRVSTLRIVLAAFLLVGSPACSLLFTSGPEPVVYPLHDCPTSVIAPVSDTVLAAASATWLAIGAADAAANQSTAGGWVAVAAGAAMGALFTTSAVLGYQRTSACRTSLEPNPPLAPPRTSLLKPPLTCAAVGDAPRVCPKAGLLAGGG